MMWFTRKDTKDTLGELCRLLEADPWAWAGREMDDTAGDDEDPIHCLRHVSGVEVQWTTTEMPRAWLQVEGQFLELSSPEAARLLAAVGRLIVARVASGAAGELPLADQVDTSEAA
jgi:hypothetical protein